MDHKPQVRLRHAIICCGFQKCGTTSLWNYVVKSSNVSHFSIKERDFFNKANSNFDIASDEFFKSGSEIFFDVSPQYACKNAADEILRFGFEKISIVFLVRDPIQRIQSHISQQLRVSDLKLEQILENVESELDALVSHYKFSRKVPVRDMLSFDMINSQVVFNSCYWSTIDYYSKKFGAENISIFDMTKVDKDPSVLNLVFKKFGFEINDVEFSKSNVGGRARFKFIKRFFSNSYIRSFFRFIVPMPIYARIWWFIKTELMIDKRNKKSIHLTDQLRLKLDIFFSDYRQ